MWSRVRGCGSDGSVGVSEASEASELESTNIGELLVGDGLDVACLRPCMVGGFFIEVRGFVWSEDVCEGY